MWHFSCSLVVDIKTHYSSLRKVEKKFLQTWEIREDGWLEKFLCIWYMADYGLYLSELLINFVYIWFDYWVLKMLDLSERKRMVNFIYFYKTLRTPT